MTDEQKETDEVMNAIKGAVEAAGMEIMPQAEFDAVVETMRQNVEASDDAAREQGRRFLNEEQDRELIETWWRDAKAFRSIDDASQFAHRLVEDYRHDYGTICHAVAAAGVAMANAVGMPAGVTGFQAGFIGWMLHKHWQQWGDEPRRIVDYTNLLYPQYEYAFRSISPDAWEWAKTEATKNLVEHASAHPEVRKHWQSIANGVVPFGLTVEAS